jgi:4'-phosphopantetheinyl transferase
MTPDRPAWSTAPASLELSASELHVWWLGAVPGDAGSTTVAWRVLGDAERRRAQRFRDEQSARAYIHSHARVRGVLARYLGTEAAAVPLQSDEQGRPVVRGRRLACSVSRSGNDAVLAVTTGTAVGVDIERVRADDDATELPWSFVRERLPATLLADLDGADARESFYLAWTRLEAYAKALTGGLAAITTATETLPCRLRSFRVGDEVVGSVVTGGTLRPTLRTFAAAPLEVT